MTLWTLFWAWLLFKVLKNFPIGLETFSISQSFLDLRTSVYLLLFFFILSRQGCHSALLLGYPESFWFRRFLWKEIPLLGTQYLFIGAPLSSVILRYLSEFLYIRWNFGRYFLRSFWCCTIHANFFLISSKKGRNFANFSGLEIATIRGENWDTFLPTANKESKLIQGSKNSCIRQHVQ